MMTHWIAGIGKPTQDFRRDGFDIQGGRKKTTERASKRQIRFFRRRKAPQRRIAADQLKVRVHERDPQGENLVCCVHPWETGTDNLPAFDPPLERTREYVARHDLRLEGFEG